jgi:hypothetical protein
LKQGETSQQKAFLPSVTRLGGVFILLWSDEHEKTEEKTKREIEPSGTARLDGRSQRYVQASAWGD